MSIEVIKVIREAEEKAEVTKKDAVQQAKQVIANANAQAAQIINQARESAESLRTDKLRTAETEGQKLYDDIIEKANLECKNILKKADKNMDNAVTIILERIVKASGNS